MSEKSGISKKQIMRMGVYGVIIKDGKILLIEQPRGPYSGKLDFPGGGIEFGESPEQTLRREFEEEVNMTFDYMTQLDNLAVVIEVPRLGEKEPYVFHQIGLIYAISGLHPPLESASGQCLKHAWIDIKTLSQANTSPFVWRVIG